MTIRYARTESTHIPLFVLLSCCQALENVIDVEREHIVSEDVVTADGSVSDTEHGDKMHNIRIDQCIPDIPSIPAFLGKQLDVSYHVARALTP